MGSGQGRGLYSPAPLSLQDILTIAGPERHAPPVEVQPPRGGNGVWTVRPMAASRPDCVTMDHDRWTCQELMRIEFTDHNPVGRFMALGVIAAPGIILPSVTGGVMHWRRW